MNRKLSTILILLAVIATGQLVAAVVANVPAKRSAPVKADATMDFQSFHLITDRNIFDMSRTGRIGPKHIAPAPKVDDFSLVGTMSYEKGRYAFFDGSSSEYRQSRKPDDTIAGFKVASVASDYVQLLATNGSTIKMPVGTGMRRENNGPWSGPTARADVTVADTTSRSRDTSGERSSDRSNDRSDKSDRSSRSDRRLYRRNGDSKSSGSDAGTSSTPEQPASSSSAGLSQEEIIKRLMEKRAKEVKPD